MFLKTMNRAMRYYRFWIYSCNIALLFATIIYMFAFIYVLNDTKMMLFPSIRLYQPTFLYSYCAIILQGGVLQVIIKFYIQILSLLSLIFLLNTSVWIPLEHWLCQRTGLMFMHHYAMRTGKWASCFDVLSDMLMW